MLTGGEWVQPGSQFIVYECKWLYLENRYVITDGGEIQVVNSYPISWSERSCPKSLTVVYNGKWFQIMTKKMILFYVFIDNANCE